MFRCKERMYMVEHAHKAHIVGIARCRRRWHTDDKHIFRLEDMVQAQVQPKTMGKKNTIGKDI